MSFHPTHSEGGPGVYTVADVAWIKATVALVRGIGPGRVQAFTDDVLCPHRCTRSEGGRPFHDPLRDRDWLVPGDELLVDVSAYKSMPAGDTLEWCRVQNLAAGSAAVYPYKVEIPERGVGQFRASEVLAWRRPVSVHEVLLHHAETSAR